MTCKSKLNDNDNYNNDELKTETFMIDNKPFYRF